MSEDQISGVEWEGYTYTELNLEDMVQAIKIRIREYEGRKFDHLMNLKTERAASHNPQKLANLKAIGQMIDDLDSAIEACKFELQVLEDQLASESSDTGEKGGDLVALPVHDPNARDDDSDNSSLND